MASIRKSGGFYDFGDNHPSVLSEEDAKKIREAYRKVSSNYYKTIDLTKSRKRREKKKLLKNKVDSIKPSKVKNKKKTAEEKYQEELSELEEQEIKRKSSEPYYLPPKKGFLRRFWEKLFK